MNIEELQSIKEKNLSLMSEKSDSKITRIMVGMSTCGISAGADEVYEAIEDEVEKLGLKNVRVCKVGCIGICKLEPLVEVIKPGEEKTTYVKITPYKGRRIVASHVFSDKPIYDFMVHVVKGKIINDFIPIND